MSSNSEEPRPPKVDRTSFSRSSTTSATAPLPARTTTELHSRPFRPKRVASLQAEDEARHLFETEPPRIGITGRLGHHGGSALRYLLQTEVHTYAFSVAANAILSFFPFIVLLLTLTRRVLHSDGNVQRHPRTAAAVPAQ